MLEIGEASATILVETSPTTAVFIHTITEQLNGVLQRRLLQGNRFLFNIGHYSKDVTFWADELVECSAENVARASEWMSGWRAVDPRQTPRGLSQMVAGPRTLTAVVSAFTDFPYAQALYLIAASPHHEKTSDLLHHVKFASKGRPVHVIFTTTKHMANLGAMELMHLISKETEGTMRVAYLDEAGSLLEVVDGGGARIVSSRKSIESQWEKSLKREDLVQLYDAYMARNQFREAGSGFHDLKIDGPKTIQAASATALITHRNPNTHTVGDDFMNIRWTLEGEEDAAHRAYLDEKQMQEIRKMFTKLYLAKKDKAHKAKPYKAVKAKLYKFKTTDDASSSDSTSSLSDSTYYEDTRERHRNAKMDLNWGQNWKMEVASSPQLTATARTWSRSQSLVPTKQRTPRQKPAWKPVNGQYKKDFIANGPKTDRSQSWTNPWTVENLKRFEAAEKKKTGQKTDKGIQAGLVQRPQSNENRLIGKTTKMQTEVEKETIQELVKQNSTLLNALQRTQRDKAVISPLEQLNRQNILRNRSKVLSKIREAQNQEKEEWEQMARVADAKKKINAEIENIGQGKTGGNRRVDTVREQQQRMEQLRRTRQDHIQRSVDHRKSVREQQQQNNYKAMYQRLLDEIQREEQKVKTSQDAGRRQPTMIIPQ